MENIHLKALNLARAGDWNSAHSLVQPLTDTLSCRIHGYLHREEGDFGNARYWYRRAGLDLPDNTLESELLSLIASASGESSTNAGA